MSPRQRIAECRLIEKMKADPECSRRLKLEITSHYKAADSYKFTAENNMFNQKERDGKNEKDYKGPAGHCDDDHAHRLQPGSESL